MTPIVGFAPDADNTTPGILTGCDHFIPYESGFMGAPSGVAAVSVPALATACIGAVVITQLDGTRRIFAGTLTKLWELVAGAWVDRSSAAYSGSSDSRWSFCQFGNTTIASNLSNNMQSSASGAFADIATAPKAKIVVSATNNFVLAFNTSDGTFGVSQDRWWCCAQGDQTDWTPDVATSATTGRLIGAEGAIEAALPLGDYVIAYKKRAIFIGTFAGAPVVWQWQLVPTGEAGVVGQGAVCDIGGAHFMVSDDNFWLFDGTRPVPIGDGIVRRWFAANSDPIYRYRTRCTFDKQTNLVRVSFPSLASGGVCDKALIYHVLRKQWGTDDVTEESSLTYISSGVTIDGLDAFSSTISGLPDISLDSQYWMAGGRISSYFNTSHQLMARSGPCVNSSFTTGDMGDDYAVTMLDSFRVRFERSPSSATAQGRYKMNEGDTFTVGPSNAMNDGKFDIRQSGRFHRVSVDMQGDVKAYAFAGKPVLLGAR